MCKKKRPDPSPRCAKIKGPNPDYVEPVPPLISKYVSNVKIFFFLSHLTSAAGLPPLDTHLISTSLSSLVLKTSPLIIIGFSGGTKTVRFASLWNKIMYESVVILVKRKTPWFKASNLGKLLGNGFMPEIYYVYEYTSFNSAERPLRDSYLEGTLTPPIFLVINKTGFDSWYAYANYTLIGLGWPHQQLQLDIEIQRRPLVIQVRYPMCNHLEVHKC